MKRTIRLKESDLHKIILQAINEINYGGMSLHGTNQNDWNKVYNLRRDRYHKTKQYTPEEEKELNAAVRNRNNARQLGDKSKNNESKLRLSESDLHRIVKESVRRILKEGNGGRYQVCIFPLDNGGMQARAVEYGSPVIKDAIYQGYIGTLEDCEAKAEKWNDKNYWNKPNFYPNYTG